MSRHARHAEHRYASHLLRRPRLDAGHHLLEQLQVERRGKNEKRIHAASQRPCAQSVDHSRTRSTRSKRRGYWTRTVTSTTSVFFTGGFILVSDFFNGGFILVSDYVRMEVTLVVMSPKTSLFFSFYGGSWSFMLSLSIIFACFYACCVEFFPFYPLLF